ncbi:hypothetical protein DRO97_06105 [Archaeoglobales archaeon]|nr:MAG: hypothetical protein DRO97_06105 [Archaeoglobales archaeon]
MVLDFIILIAVAFLFSLHQICIRKGTIEFDVISGTFISIFTTAFIFSALSINRMYFTAEFVVFMILAGVLHFFVARTAFYNCINRIGANLAGPLSATRIYFAALFGFLIGEVISIKIVLMTTFIFLGIVLLSNPKKGVRADFAGIILGIATGLTAAFSSVLVKFGMQIYPDAIFGSSIGYLSSLILYPIFFRNIEFDLKKGRFFVLGGIFVGFGHFLRYYELIKMPVSVVEPVFSIYPLFTIILSYVFLKEKEIFSLRVVLGTISILLGINFYFL